MTTVSVSEARANLRGVLERVKAGEELALTQHGDVVAILLHPSQARARRQSPLLDAGVRRLEDLLEARRHLAGRGAGISAARAQKLTAGVRAARDEH